MIDTQPVREYERHFEHFVLHLQSETKLHRFLTASSLFKGQEYVSALTK